MKSFQKQLYCLTVSLLVILLSLPAKAHSGYDYTSNSTVADTLGGILNGSIPIFDDGKGYAVGSSIGDGRHDFGGTFGWTCWAYANAVYYKLFGSVPQSSGTNVVNIVGTTSASYDSFLSAGVKCGTYMRTEGNGGHSIIILSYNPSIITWVDANWSSDGVIKIHNESYSFFNTWYINYKGRRLNRVINPSYVIPPTPNNDDTSSINKTYRIKSTTTLGLNIRNVPTTSNNAPIGLLNPGDTIVCTKRTNYQANGYYWLFGTSSTGIPGWITENYEWIEEVSPTPTTAYLDVNGWLDATFSGNLGDCGTVDVYINGELVANDVNDYYTAWPVGTTYEISDIRARQGYIYRGAHISYLSGKIDSSGTDVELSFDRDGILPTISNVAVANITSEGYTVTCTVTDNTLTFGIKNNDSDRETYVIFDKFNVTYISASTDIEAYAANLLNKQMNSEVKEALSGIKGKR